MVRSNFNSPPPPPAAAVAKANLPMLYYGLIVVGTASIVLALYNLIVLRWCADRRSLSPERQSPLAEIAAAAARGSVVAVPASFRYKKEMAAGEDDRHYDCAVCLSVFEEGEEIRRLPRCRHAFHAQCIDMWLFSHADCPLCRAPVAAARRCGRRVATPAEETREGLAVNSVLPV